MFPGVTLPVQVPQAFFLFFTGELSTLRQMMKVPNEPGLSPNNGLENVFPSRASKMSWRQDDQP